MLKWLFWLFDWFSSFMFYSLQKQRWEVHRLFWEHLPLQYVVILPSVSQAHTTLLLTDSQLSEKRVSWLSSNVKHRPILQQFYILLKLAAVFFHNLHSGVMRNMTSTFALKIHYNLMLYLFFYNTCRYREKINPFLVSNYEKQQLCPADFTRFQWLN